jgi:preprotein translocase subunit SecF
LLRTEFVGAQVGEDLRERSGLGVLVALGAIMLYVSLRFQIKFALAAKAVPGGPVATGDVDRGG